MIERPSLDARIVAQAATFTLSSTTCQSFDEFLETQELGEALTRYVIPAEDVARVRDQHDLVGVDERRLFPDLDGVASAIQRYYGRRFARCLRSHAISQHSLVSLAPPALAAWPIDHARVTLDGANLVSAAVSNTHGDATAGRERSSYGRRIQSKNAHVRFQESICAGESTRSSVRGSTRRLKAWPTDAPHGAGST